MSRSTARFVSLVVFAAALALMFAMTKAASSREIAGEILAGLGACFCAAVGGAVLTRDKTSRSGVFTHKHPLRRAITWFCDPLNWFWPVRRDPLAASLDERLAQEKELQSNFYQTIVDEAVPTFLFEAITKNVDAKHDGIKTLESKAASQIGFAGTIIAIFAALGGREHFLWLGVPLGISILASLRAIFVKEYNLPSPIVYNLDTILADPNNKARIASALTESYAQYGLDLGVAAGRTARYVNLGTVGLVIGVIALLILTLLGKGPSRPVSITCPQPSCVIVEPKGLNDGGTTKTATAKSKLVGGQKRVAAPSLKRKLRTHTDAHAPARKGAGKLPPGQR